MLRLFKRLYSVPPRKILFFGSDNFSCKVLNSLVSKRDSIEVVLPFNSNQPLRKFAYDNGLKCYRAPPRNSGWSDWQFPKQEFDLGIVVSFGYFLPRWIIERFKMGTLNVHPSLLPVYRGSAPIQYAIWNRDAITGVSIIDLSPVAFDSGKVLNQVKVKLTGDEYFDELHDRLAGIGGNLLADTLDNLNSYQLKAWTQDETRVTKAPKIKVEHGQINWIRDEVDEIFARYRAFGQKIPLYSFIKGKRVKFLSIQDPKSSVPALDHEKNANFGRIAYLESTKLLYVKCKDGWIPVRELVVDGKKPTCAKDFRNGHLMDGKSNSFEYIQG